MPSPAVRAIIMGGYVCPEARAFLARTTGLDNKHRRAYIALINGLVRDGVWATLDLLQIYATQDQTTANLNLISSSYTATPQGSPAWAADVGYTTDFDKWVGTGWMPTNGVKFQQDSAQVSVWSGSTAGSFRSILGLNTSFAANRIYLRPRDADKIYGIINDDDPADSTTANTDASGLLGIDRVNSTTKSIWRNGVKISADITRSSEALIAVELVTGGSMTVSGSDYNGIIRSMASGASLDSGHLNLWMNYYTRMSQYMVSIGASP